MNGNITKQELEKLMERMGMERPLLRCEKDWPSEDFSPFLGGRQVWGWETSGIPVTDAVAWIEEKMDKIPQRMERGIGHALLYIWSSAPRTALKDLSWACFADEVDRLFIELFDREDLEETKLGLLLLVSVNTQPALKKIPARLSPGLPLLFGANQSGRMVEGYMTELRHLLIAGRPGTKIGAYTADLLRPPLQKVNPREVQLILITSPKGELLQYGDSPYLLLPAITEPKTAVTTLWETLDLLKRRHQTILAAGARDIQTYNVLSDTVKMPSIIVVLEELAELIDASPAAAEIAICHIARYGHNAGVHLMIATEHPAAEVITGFIKVNVPSRISFAVDSAMESRIIIDTSGAEHLGEEELLYRPLGVSKPIRLKIEQRHCSSR